MADITRKCPCCNQTMSINKNNIREAIYYDGKTYHSKCFEDMCEKRSKNKRINISEKWTEILININAIKKDSFTHLMSSLYKEDIFSFIQNAYGLTIVPSTVWQRISDINSGNYKYMCGNGIPLEHLLDMWQRKINMLNRVANDNTRKGKVMNSTQRIIYDLSILVNKYDSYKKYLEKQRIYTLETEKIANESLVSLAVVSQKNMDNKNTSDDTDDMSDIVDDIFG